MENKQKTPNNVWKLEKADPKLAIAVKEKLREVRDPEIGMDIIQLGMVREIELFDDKAQLTMILTTPYCPYGPMLMESARKKAEEVIGRKTEITYGNEPWDRTMMEEGSGFDWGLF